MNPGSGWTPSSNQDQILLSKNNWIYRFLCVRWVLTCTPPAIGASYTNSYKHGGSVRLEGATTSIETIRFCFRCCIKKNRLRRHGGKQAARAACLPACLPACRGVSSKKGVRTSEKHREGEFSWTRACAHTVCIHGCNFAVFELLSVPPPQNKWLT